MIPALSDWIENSKPRGTFDRQGLPTASIITTALNDEHLRMFDRHIKPARGSARRSLLLMRGEMRWPGSAVPALKKRQSQQCRTPAAAIVVVVMVFSLCPLAHPCSSLAQHQGCCKPKWISSLCLFFEPLVLPSTISSSWLHFALYLCSTLAGFFIAEIVSRLLVGRVYAQMASLRRDICFFALFSFLPAYQRAS